MKMDDIPLWLLFFGTVLIVVATIELGYLLGKAASHRKEEEKEAPVSAIAGTVLALLAFILAFTFGIVANRYDTRRELVREQANAISTAYDRADFLPESMRGESKELFRTYIDTIVLAGKTGTVQSSVDLAAEIRKANSIGRQIWEIAVADVRAGDTTDISALYVDSLNHMNDVLATRIAVAVGSRLPMELWIMLYLLVGLAMFAVGYQTAIAKSQRTWMMIVLALSFSVVIVLIAALDDPERGYLEVSQRPLTDLQAEMSP
jgi:hypothetical protein